MSRKKADISIGEKRWLTFEEAMAYTETCEKNFKDLVLPKLKYVYSPFAKGKSIEKNDKLLFDKTEIDAIFFCKFRYNNPYAL